MKSPSGLVPVTEGGAERLGSPVAGREVQTPQLGHKVLQATQPHCPEDAPRCEFPFAAETKEHRLSGLRQH